MVSHSESSVNVVCGDLENNVQSTVSPEGRIRVDEVLNQFQLLNDQEKMLCILKIRTDSTGVGPPGSIDNDGGTESNLAIGGFSVPALQLSGQIEQGQAFTWIKSHLEEDPSTCLRKDEVYDDYKAYCEKHHMKILNTADFGKVMKRAFPNVRPRRLGQRGQSRYCYGGMRKKLDTQAPTLPDLAVELANSNAIDNYPSASSSISSSDERLVPFRGITEEVRAALGVEGSIIVDVIRVIIEYARTVVGGNFTSLMQLAHHLVSHRFVTTQSPHALSIISYNQQQQRVPASTVANLSSQCLSNILTPASASAGALFEAIDKGFFCPSYKSPLESKATDNASSSYAFKPSVSAQSSPIVSQPTHKSLVVKKEAADPSLDVNSPSAPAGSVGSRSSSIPSQPSPSTSGTGVQAPSAPSYHHSPPPTVSNAPIPGTPTVPSGSYQQNPQYVFPFSQFAPNSRPLQAPQAYPLTYINQRNQQHHGYSSERRASFAEGTSSYLTQTGTYGHSLPTALYGNRCFVPSVAAPAVSFSSTSVEATTFVSHNTPAHQPLQQSHSLRDPPAPQPPPGGSGRSPFAAVPYRIPAKPQTCDIPGAVEPIVRFATLRLFLRVIVPIPIRGWEEGLKLFPFLPTLVPCFALITAGEHCRRLDQVEFVCNGGTNRIARCPCLCVAIDVLSCFRLTRSIPCESHVRNHLGGLSPRKDFFSGPGDSATSSTTPSGSAPAAYQQSDSRTTTMESRSDYFHPCSDFTAMSPAVIMPPEAGTERASWTAPVVGESPVYDAASSDTLEYDRLPHVGASPCPQHDPEIPPSSPTKFLKFYSSQGGCLTSRRPRSSAVEDLDRTLTNLSPESPTKGDGASKQPLHVYVSEEDSGTLDIAAQREALHDALSTPTGESERYGQSHSSGTASSASSKGPKAGPSSASSDQGVFGPS
ncbi:hypothetical protein Aperf_G00000068109 [Anoplocephala perfoliata]